jgi:hypothetical protein
VGLFGIIVIAVIGAAIRVLTAKRKAQQTARRKAKRDDRRLRRDGATV